MKRAHWLIKAHVKIVEESYTGQRDEEGPWINYNEYDIGKLNKSFSDIRDCSGPRTDKRSSTVIHQPIYHAKITHYLKNTKIKTKKILNSWDPDNPKQGMNDLVKYLWAVDREKWLKLNQT